MSIETAEVLESSQYHFPQIANGGFHRVFLFSANRCFADSACQVEYSALTVVSFALSLFSEAFLCFSV
jgi:hypothetical protein